MGVFTYSPLPGRAIYPLMPPGENPPNRENEYERERSQHLQDEGEEFLSVDSSTPSQLPATFTPPLFVKRTKRSASYKTESTTSVDKGVTKKKNQRICTRCATSVSPRWRKGPAGSKSLCNACGIRHLESVRREMDIPETEQTHRITIRALVNQTTHPV